MIGAGSQSEFQAVALRTETGADRLRIYDTDPAAAEKARRNLEPLGFEVTIVGSAADAVQGAQIVTTCTADKRRAVVLSADDLGPGVHVNAIGGDCPGKTELDPRILDVSSVFVEHTPQTRIEGEIQNRPSDFPVTELWEVIEGRAPGRTDAQQITVFDSVGFAIEDFTALTLVERETRGTRFAGELRLVTEPDDPRDLFGFLGTPVPVV